MNYILIAVLVSVTISAMVLLLLWAAAKKAEVKSVNKTKWEPPLNPAIYPRKSSALIASTVVRNDGVCAIRVLFASGAKFDFTGIYDIRKISKLGALCPYDQTVIEAFIKAARCNRNIEAL